MDRDDSSPPLSPLSSVSSSAASEVDIQDDYDESELRPSKRLKTSGDAADPEAEVDAEVEGEIDVEADAVPDAVIDGISDVSSDTSGDVPNSPVNARQDEEDLQEQVSFCSWDGCSAGDMGNLDRLVEHIHNEHIESRHKKYTCEWSDCGRKGIAHASGYALKAHMRKHTREKPFYCYLPGRLLS